MSWISTFQLFFLSLQLLRILERKQYLLNFQDFSVEKQVHRHLDLNNFFPTGNLIISIVRLFLVEKNYTLLDFVKYFYNFSNRLIKNNIEN